MRSRIFYDTSNVASRDFAMPVEEIITDGYCARCEASLSETDYDCGKCTQCHQPIEENNDD